MLALVVTALISRALHLDGLADLADGLTSGHDPARSLEVMRRGDTGPAGAAASSSSSCSTPPVSPPCSAAWLGRRSPSVALVASRIACAVCARDGIPPARQEGLGQGVAGTVGRAHLIGLVVTVGALAAVAGASLSGALPGVSRGATALAAAAVVLTAAAAAVMTRRHAVRRLGGITGDVIGGAVEIALAAGLVTASLAVTVLPRL